MGELLGPLGYLFNLIFTFPIFNGLVLLYHLFGDFALSIVVLTVFIKLVLFPLTLQQLKSMKATQALQPRMAEIRKKYAKDQAAQAQAMQALYKEYGVNPAAGCLPLIPQLLVLYGLFNALNNVLRPVANDNALHTKALANINAAIYPFLPHFHSFSQINLDFTWFAFIGLHFPLNQPDPTHVLPILAGIVTFIQLRMSQPKTTGTASANDPSAQSMKTMQYIMPLITVFFGWTFAAGLALYWTVSSVFQAVQQYFVTGWGALLTTPNLKTPPATTNESRSSGLNGTSNGSLKTKSYAGDQRKERAIQEVAESEGTSESDGPVASKLRTTPQSNGSTAARRRSGSSSARRRSSNNTQRRNVSRR